MVSHGAKDFFCSFSLVKMGVSNFVFKLYNYMINAFMNFRAFLAALELKKSIFEISVLYKSEMMSFILIYCTYIFAI